MSVIEAGGEDLETADEVFEIYTEAGDFAAVRDALEAEGYELDNAELTMVPQTEVPLSDEDYETLMGIIDALEDDDDVSEVYHNGVKASEQ